MVDMFISVLEFIDIASGFVYLREYLQTKKIFENKSLCFTTIVSILIYLGLVIILFLIVMKVQGYF